MIVLLFAYVYSVEVRRENIALRGLSAEFYDINRIYQSKLHQVFLAENPVTEQDELIKAEKETLEAVCQRICNIFEETINRKCMVTIKLITYEGQHISAHTYVRSLKASARDMSERVRYSVGTGQNTGFEVALRERFDDKPSHFYSADLSLEPSYKNQRADYLRHYRSVLVVPIREPQRISDIGADPVCEPRNADSGNPGSDPYLIGFLCVDTLSINRLNDTFHLVMLSALASQMYTFMCFMRRNYKVQGDA
jgi:GAF domain-containing protein